VILSAGLPGVLLSAPGIPGTTERRAPRTLLDAGRWHELFILTEDGLLSPSGCNTSRGSATTRNGVRRAAIPTPPLSAATGASARNILSPNRWVGAQKPRRARGAWRAGPRTKSRPRRRIAPGDPQNRRTFFYCLSPPYLPPPTFYLPNHYSLLCASYFTFFALMQHHLSLHASPIAPRGSTASPAATRGPRPANRMTPTRICLINAGAPLPPTLGRR